MTYFTIFCLVVFLFCTKSFSDAFWLKHSWIAAPLRVSLGFPCGSAGKESACNAGYLSSITGWGRSPGEGESYPVQYSGLENSIGSQRVRHDWATELNGAPGEVINTHRSLGVVILDHQATRGSRFQIFPSSFGSLLFSLSSGDFYT